MPSLKPLSRREFVRKLKASGFQGPYAGGKHDWMRRGSLRITGPNPHSGDLDPGLIRRILREAGISVDAWNRV